jgi:predicted RND superfamily exporter protein
VLSLGFGIPGFSQTSNIANIGLLAAAGVVSTLLATIFVTPVLLVYLKPFGSLVPEPTSMKR